MPTKNPTLAKAILSHLRDPYVPCPDPVQFSKETAARIRPEDEDEARARIQGTNDAGGILLALEPLLRKEPLQ